MTYPNLNNHKKYLNISALAKEKELAPPKIAIRRATRHVNFSKVQVCLTYV